LYLSVEEFGRLCISSGFAFVINIDWSLYFRWKYNTYNFTCNTTFWKTTEHKTFWNTAEHETATDETTKTV